MGSNNGSKLPVVPVVIDCDPGIDDAMAIFYGLRAPELDIVAIGTVWGNCGVELATTNALRLLEIGGHPRIPVAMGADRPLIGPEPTFSGLIHGKDGQGNTDLPAPNGQPSGERAADQLIRLGHERPGALTLVAMGPLTNLAMALALDPGIAQLYREVVIMGGTFFVPGNVRPLAEANIWHDPEAAQRVLDAGWPVTMVGLDVTTDARVSQTMLDDLNASGSAEGAHLARISGIYLSVYAQRFGRREAAMHDALALGVVADPALLVRAPRVRVDVELCGVQTRGMTIADLRSWVPQSRANARVALEADGLRFAQRWMEALSGPSHAKI